MLIGDIQKIPGYSQGNTILQGKISERPDPGFTNTIFISIDTKSIYRDNGTSWEILTSSGGVLTGGTLSGSLYLYGDPTSNLEAATKQYVDNSILIIDGGSF